MSDTMTATKAERQLSDAQGFPPVADETRLS
jgi:hypothetical protein